MNMTSTLSNSASCSRRRLAAALFRAAGCSLLVLTLASCGGSSPPPPPPRAAIPSITLSPSSVSLTHSLTGPSTVQFNAVVQNATDSTIDWSLADAQTVSPYDLGTISETGLYTAPERGYARTVMVTATLHSNAAYRATASIQLKCAATLALKTPDGTSVATGQRLRIGVESQNSCNTSPVEVTWSVNGKSGLDLTSGYIVGDSLTSAWFYAPPTSPASAVTITAVSTTDAERRSSILVTVRPDTETLAISPSEATVNVGTIQPFVVTRGGQETAVSWRVNSSEEADARVGWMRGSDYFAPFTIPNPAQVVVVAADTSSTPSRFATALVTVTAPAPNANHRLQGTYAALLTGDYAFWLGTVAFDGKGGISGSGRSGSVLELETFVSETQSVFTGKTYAGTISGSYEAGWDGQVVIRATLPGALLETWNLTFFAPDHAEGTGSGVQVLERQDLSGLSSSAIVGTYRLNYGLFGYYYGGPGGDCFTCPAWYPPRTTFTSRLGIVRADATGQLAGEFEPGAYASDTSPVPMTGAYSVDSSGIGTAFLNLADQPPSDSLSTVAVSANRFLFAGLSPMGKFAVGVAERQPQGFVLSGPYVFQTENQLVKFEADGAGHIRGTLDQAVWNAYSGSWDWQVLDNAPFQATYSADSYGRITVAVTEAAFGKPSFVLVPVASDKFLVSVVRPAPNEMAIVSAGTGEGYAQVTARADDMAGRYGIRGRFGGSPGGWVLLDSEQPSVGLSGDLRPIRFQFTRPAPDSSAKACFRHLWPDYAFGLPSESSYYAATADILLLRDGVLEKIRW